MLFSSFFVPFRRFGPVAANTDSIGIEIANKVLRGFSQKNDTKKNILLLPRFAAFLNHSRAVALFSATPLPSLKPKPKL